jgi:hypothetical protein
MTNLSRPPIRVANVAGLYGDRLSAPQEMLDGGDVDVLTGDWLAELTMLILARTRAKRPDGGYARTFVSQMEQVMGTCLDRGVRVVANAGGLDPLGCAAAVQEVADRLGLAPTIAAVTGDDLARRMADLHAGGEEFLNLDTGEPLASRIDDLVTANAYLGAWQVAAALDEGADVVVTGRVTDAAVVAGPAMSHFGWERNDWDRLAGAIAAGHVIECGCQATGGNYSFFSEIQDLHNPGFPWADIHEDGSSIIGKHDGTGGEVSIGTVTSQVLYEIGGERYLNPDVTVRMDSITLDQVGRDRVRISGVKGEPPPETLKVAAAITGGYRNTMTIGLTGLDLEAKAELVQQQWWDDCAYDPGDYEEVRATLVGSEDTDPDATGRSNAGAIAFLELSVRDRDERKTGRAWSNTAATTALSSIPGFFPTTPPGPARPFAIYWPTTVSRTAVSPKVHIGDRMIDVPETVPTKSFEAAIDPVSIPPAPGGPAARVPLGRLFGARSGDKGGKANLGVFARSGEAYAWLADFLDVARLRRLLPDLAPYTIDRHEFPRISALNFIIHGLLDEGVNSTLRVDPQAKGLGEYLRSAMIEAPIALLDA